MLSVKAEAQPALLDSIITEEKLKAVVYEIADDSLQGRFTNSGGCIKAASIIATRMQAVGVKKIKGMVGYSHGTAIGASSAVNVIGVLPGSGKNEESIIISAHYDHLGTVQGYDKNPGFDIIFNGANDDASGVAVLLALAEYFANMPIERSIIFVAFSGEEIGFLGSKELSRDLIADKIIAQINLEMLGRKGVYKKPFITGHWYSNLRNLLNQSIRDTTGEKNYFNTDDRSSANMFQRSDNLPMAMLGIPAHTIMLTTDADPFYHTVDDEPETLDYKMMCVISKNIALAILPLVQGRVTPQRINSRIIPVRNSR